MSDLEKTLYVQLVMPDWSPGQHAPSDAEIVAQYWRSQASRWEEAFQLRLREYDELTLRLCHAFGDDWKVKVAKALERKDAA